MGAGIVLRGLTKRYADVFAVRNVDLEIAPGEFVSLLGPSGSGKTTTMMAIAGFVDNIGGEILIGGRRVDHLPPHRRDVGVVFQHLALFPHMTVAENIGFPLKLRGARRLEIARRVGEALDLIQLSGFGKRLPSELSGGQQQRVALARATIFRPQVLLLDEPLAALDKKLRETMQAELRALHRQLGITIVHVTHDQIEAMAVSDRIVVMRDGQVEQTGTPADLYHRPANAFVAGFLGDSSCLFGRLATSTARGGTVVTGGGLSCGLSDAPAHLDGQEVMLMLRPEHIRLGVPGDGGSDRVSGQITSLVFEGDRLRCQVRLNQHDMITIVLPSRDPPPGVVEGGVLTLAWSPDDILLFPRM